MIPIRDNVPSRRVPLVNYLLIAVSVGVFAIQVTSERPLAEEYGMIPARIVRPGESVEVPQVEQVEGELRKVGTRPAADPPIHPWWTILTCIFLHGGLLHLVGNMWFLFLFGDNVEDRFGHLGYLLFYVACGVAASVVHVVSAPFANLPTIGASGAVAGVMGSYFLLYPRARVLTFIPPFFLIVIPAAAFLGIWLGIQFLQGMFALVDSGPVNVAWWAHVGGFVAGVVATWSLYHARMLYADMSSRVADEDRRYRVPLHRDEP